MDDLATLVLATKGARSYADLAKAAGGKPTAARLQQIATGEELRAIPDPDTIRGMAQAMGVSERTVFLAAGRSVGLTVDTREPRLVTLLPPWVTDLSDDEVGLILQLLRVLHHAHAAGNPTPSPTTH